MKIYRVVVEWPNRANVLDRMSSELFESEDDAYRHLNDVRNDQEVYGLEPGETLRLEIYDSEPAITEYMTFEQED
jgi:hypothetical protein